MPSSAWKTKKEKKKKHIKKKKKAWETKCVERGKNVDVWSERDHVCGGNFTEEEDVSL